MGFFRTDGEGWSCAENYDGDRVTFPMPQRGRVPLGKRVRTRNRYEKEGEYSPINKLTKQILQTILTSNKIMQQTNFLIWVKIPGCYNTTPPTRDLVPRSWTIDPGERRGEKKESTIFNTTNKGLCSMSTSSFHLDKIFVERRQRRKTKPSRDQEEE